MKSSPSFAFLLLAALLSFLPPGTFAQQSPPKREVRAVWITTALGLDWPKSTDPTEQRQSLREMIRLLADARYNTIFFQVRGRADAMYRSHFEPWSQQLTGVLGKDPGWDPLALVIEEAHARGIEVHAWFNTVMAKNGGGPPPDSRPRHAILAHPDWVRQTEGEYWFDAGIPAVREYLVRVAMDVVRQYDIDGFQFDYLRYPAQAFPDDQTFRKFGKGMQKADWRRQNINTIARMLHDSVAHVKPMLKLGSAPIGIYENFGKVRGLQSFSELSQDSRRWAAEGWQDYLAPQVYWTLGTSRGDPDFAAVVRDWVGHKSRSQLYIGIGAYKPDVAAEMPALIDSARSMGVDGVGFFRYSSIAASPAIGGRFPTLALVPPMPWKDSVPPLPPRRVAVRHFADDVFGISWEQPQRARDGDLPAKYIVYRSPLRNVDVDDPAEIVAILQGSVLSYVDTVKGEAGGSYAYAVTSLDRGNNESAPAIEHVTVPALVSLANAIKLPGDVAAVVRGKTASMVYIPYELSRKSAAALRILDFNGKEISRLVGETQEAGRYVVSFDASRLGAGVYYAQLTADDRKVRIPFTVDH